MVVVAQRHRPWGCSTREPCATNERRKTMFKTTRNTLNSLICLAATLAAIIAVTACGRDDGPEFSATTAGVAPIRYTAPTEPSDPPLSHGTSADQTSGRTTPDATMESTTSTTWTTSTEGTMPTEPGPSLPALTARPVVQLTVQGMFPVTRPFLGNGPKAVVYDDGTLLVSFRGNAGTEPQVWPYEVGHVDPRVITALLASADEHGLLAEPRPYAPNAAVVDAPRTTLVLVTTDGIYRHVADGLVGEETDPQRLALRRFIGEIETLTMEVEPASPFFEPTQMAIVAASTDPVSAANEDWPDDSVQLATATKCTVVNDPATVRKLNDALARGQYRQGGASYIVASRILPPGTTC